MLKNKNLEKGLVAYYPFDGDVEEANGVDNKVEVPNAMLTGL